MQVEQRASFVRDLRRSGNRKLRENVQRKVEELERASSFWDIPGVKKLRGANNLYRIRIGSYRLTVEVIGNRLTLLRFRHRRDIYRSF